MVLPALHLFGVRGLGVLAVLVPQGADPWRGSFRALAAAGVPITYGSGSRDVLAPPEEAAAPTF